MSDTTPGQLLINRALPESMRGYSKQIGKREISELLAQVAENHPDEYKKVVQELSHVGQHVANSEGSSITLAGLIQPPEIRQKIAAHQREIYKIAARRDLTDAQRADAIVAYTAPQLGNLRQSILDHGMATGNPLAVQAKSGSRGNANQLQQLIAGDGLVQDYTGNVIPIPLLRGYAQGLDPAEMWAASYGARQGVLSSKISTAQGGYLSKQLMRASHRQVVTAKDCGTTAGDPMKATDHGLVGTVLAKPMGGFEAGHVLRPSDLKKFDPKSTVYVRSPMTCKAHDGICALCAGARGGYKLPQVGDTVGMVASQALGERAAQGALQAKHSGGQVKSIQALREAGRSGIKFIDRLIQSPSEFDDQATLARVDGTVSHIQEAPQGGHLITIGNEEHYAGPQQQLLAKVGQPMEAGDALTDGIPAPGEVVQYKGIGAGRRYMSEALLSAFHRSGLAAERRNTDIVAAGLVNHVRITDPDGVAGHMIDDLVPYSAVRNSYQPRQGAQELHPHTAVGKYLEADAGIHTIGTRVSNAVAHELADQGIQAITVHDRPPPFEAEYVPARETLTHDLNPLTRLGGAFLEKGFTKAVQFGQTSKTHDTSYIPSLAKGTDFGDSVGTSGVF